MDHSIARFLYASRTVSIASFQFVFACLFVSVSTDSFITRQNNDVDNDVIFV